VKRLPRSFYNLLGLVIALVVVFVYFSIREPHSFPTKGNIDTLARQSTTVMLLSLGMTYVIVSAGIDLSVGSTAAFSCVVIAWILNKHYSPAVALLGGVLAGGLAGFVNGFLITRLKVVPFIVTLGTMLIIRGVGTGLANEETINPPDSWLTSLLGSLDDHSKWQIFPTGVWLTIALAIVMALILRFTRYGRHVIAVGSNSHAARLCGVPVERVTLWVYVISGVFAGLAGLMLFSRLTVGDPTVADGLELDAIAAVVIGGASLNGGEGSIAGTVLGALIMATLTAGAAMVGWDNWVQKIITGVIIVLAVALDRFRKQRAAS
jgi:ribose/xylose/arabinose/galactoside ABC-type transport system permease subunit